jgi:hypothetical protein
MEDRAPIHLGTENGFNYLDDHNDHPRDYDSQTPACFADLGRWGHKAVLFGLHDAMDRQVSDGLH